MYHPPQQGTRPEVTKIIFKARNKHGEREKVVHELVVDPSDLSSVERVAIKDAQNQKPTVYDKDLGIITPAQCFNSAIEDGINNIVDWPPLWSPAISGLIRARIWSIPHALTSTLYWRNIWGFT